MNPTAERMQKVTTEQFQSNFDALIERVENGESFVIQSEYGDAMIIPYGKYQEEIDDLMRIYTNHEEGC